MTEQEWLSCTNPKAMLDFLGDKASDRKLRLFACACCRRIWNLFTDERARTAVDVAERYADGLNDEAAWAAAGLGARIAHAEALDTWAHNLAVRATSPQGRDAAYQCAAAWGSKWHRSVLAGMVRDLFVNPFRLFSVAPAWLAWNDSIIPHLAQGIYEDRAFDRLPILGDALEEAGCTDQAVLDHLRGPGPHARGCWPVDTVLALE
jgi:hypothetical protein